MKKLDPREKRFVSEYLLDLNAERAAVAAGYSKSVAHTKAYQWVSNSKTKPHVFNAIQKAVKKRADKYEITADRVLGEIAKLAYSNIKDFLHIENGDVYVDLSKMTPEQSAALSEIVVDRHIYRGRRGRNGNGDEIRRTKVKLADKISALALLGKHLKLFTEVHHHTGSVSLAERMERAEKAGE